MERGRPEPTAASGAIGTGCTPPSFPIRNEYGLRGERRETGWLGRENRREGSEEERREKEEGDGMQLCVECLSLFSGSRRGTRQGLCEVRGNLHRLREMEGGGGEGGERERNERVCYQGQSGYELNWE